MQSQAKQLHSTDQSIENLNDPSLGIANGHLSEESYQINDRDYTYGLTNYVQNTDTTENDHWIERHMNFLEDFAKEGQHLKDDIQMKRKNNKQKQNQPNSIERLNEQFFKQKRQMLNTNIS